MKSALITISLLFSAMLVHGRDVLPIATSPLKQEVEPRDHLQLQTEGLWDQIKHESLATQAEQKRAFLLTQATTYYYPFGIPLRCALERQGEEAIKILGFGSLMNPKSAARTLSQQTLATRRPAVAFGLKRIYNYALSRDGVTRAMLNTALSWSSRDVVNGVVFEIPKDEILALCEREIGYDLVPVVTVDWEDALLHEEPKFYVAYALRATNKPHLGKRYTEQNIIPFPSYYDTVKQAAASYGPDFLNIYMQNTYVSDGQTTLTEWEKCQTINDVEASFPLREEG